MSTPSKDMMKVMGLRKTAAKGKSGAGTRKYNRQKAKLGKELTWAEEQQLKELGSRKVMKKLFNDMAKVKFRDPKMISHIFSPNTRTGPRSAPGWVGVRMEGGVEGWLNTESLKVWRKSETAELLFTLDRLADTSNLSGSDEWLRTRFVAMTPKQQALLSTRVAEMDWDYIWIDIYHNKGTDAGDLHAKQQSLYDQMVQMMDEIEQM